MPIFWLLDLERMLIYQNFFYGKVLFFTQLSYHLMCKLLKKCYMLSNMNVCRLWYISRNAYLGLHIGILAPTIFFSLKSCMQVRLKWNYFHHLRLTNSWDTYNLHTMNYLVDREVDGPVLHICDLSVFLKLFRKKCPVFRLKGNSRNWENYCLLIDGL